MDVGLHEGLTMSEYLAIDACGSTRLSWLATSPKHYRHMLTAPPEDTEAFARGSALHMAVLEPELFRRTYWPEPDPATIAPDAAKPRATAAYRAAIASIEAKGLKVMRREMWDAVHDMAIAIAGHPHAGAAVDQCGRRELAAVWRLDGHLCRGRFDGVGENLIMDIKTTRSLRDFSPWAITKLGYYRQAGFYAYGADELGLRPHAFLLVAVESAPPHDVGVFVVGEDLLRVGLDEARALLRVLGQCERSGRWPGMYPNVEQARITDSAASVLAELPEEGVAANVEG